MVCSRNNLKTNWRIKVKLGLSVHMGGTMRWLDFGVMRLVFKVTVFGNLLLFTDINHYGSRCVLNFCMWHTMTDLSTCKDSLFCFLVHAHGQYQLSGVTIRFTMVLPCNVVFYSLSAFRIIDQFDFPLRTRSLRSMWKMPCLIDFQKSIYISHTFLICWWRRHKFRPCAVEDSSSFLSLIQHS